MELTWFSGSLEKSAYFSNLMLVVSTLGKLICVVIKETRKLKNFFGSQIPISCIHHSPALQNASPKLIGRILLLREWISDI